MKFTFIDNENLCVYDNGKVERYESTYITRYRETTLRDQKSKEWKKNSDAMLYDDFFGTDRRVDAELLSISPTLDEHQLVYTFSVNESSGIYYKFTNDEKKTEAHILSSNDATFRDVVVNIGGDIAGVVQSNPLTSDIALFSKDGGDYKCVTGGDSLDEHPFFGRNGDVYFNSYGVGRDYDNEFVRYAPSEILKLNVRSLQIDTLLSDGKNSYIKPMLDHDGNLYCIRKPGDDKETDNVFLNILLIPVRIVEALIGFVSMFVTIFTGKPLVGGKGKTPSGGGAAKNADGKKTFVNNHMLNVEKELKRNAKDGDGGFIPRSWKLVKIPKNPDDFNDAYLPASAVELASGVADYCLLEENGEPLFLYTNGKRIFSLTAKGEKKKLCNAEFCVKLGALQTYSDGSTDLFGSL